MPRVRRKTPHEPVTAVPHVGERAPLPRERAQTPRSLAIALNRGRPKLVPAPLPPPAAPSAPPERVPPLRDRLARHVGDVELLVFRIGAESFALELCAVEEAVEEVRIQPVPDAPPSLLGVFPLRDRTLPVYAPARALGLTERDASEVALVVRAAETRVALVVDEVDDVFETPLGAVRPAPASDATDGIVLGIVWRGRELIALLDPDALLQACAAVLAPAPDSP